MTGRDIAKITVTLVVFYLIGGFILVSKGEQLQLLVVQRRQRPDVGKRLELLQVLLG